MMSKPYPASAKARLAKSARLAVLLELDRSGLLDGRSNQAIANVFGHGLHRSTILRDRRQLTKLKREVSRLRRELDPKRP
jgi:hypothetical protein